MKTKYILHGGNAQTTCPENDNFFREILKGTPDKLKVLLVHFASGYEMEEINKQKDTAQFDRVKANKEITFVTADEVDFAEQVADSDVIYFGKGTTVKLLESLKKYGDMKPLLSGKIVAGESAGANVFSSYCFSKSGGGILKCLGIVPIKLVCHFEGQHKEELDAVPENLETLTLSNYQFKVFEID